MQIRVHQIGPGMIQQTQSVCSDCHGEGEIIPAKDRCKKCEGKKVVREDKRIEVHIDKGFQDDTIELYFGLLLICCYRNEGWPKDHICQRR